MYVSGQRLMKFMLQIFGWQHTLTIMFMLLMLMLMTLLMLQLDVIHVVIVKISTSKEQEVELEENGYKVVDANVNAGTMGPPIHVW